jgi:hypothetical protein
MRAEANRMKGRKLGMAWRAAASILGALIWAFLAQTATAGAWPRDEGETFIATFVGSDRQSIYVEYGLGRGWTLGAEAGRGTGGQADAFVFLNHPMSLRVLGGRLASGVAVGARDDVAVLRSGVFWGRGFSAPFGGGWMALDGQVELQEHGPRTGKLDATIGFRPREGVQVMFQVQASGVEGGATTVRLEPAMALEQAPGRDIVIAPSIGILGPEDPQIRVGLWLKF